MRKAPLATAILAATGMTAATAVSADELFIYNWTNYTSPEVIEKFEEETGISVTLDVYTSNEDLMARLIAGDTGFDIALPSDSYVERMLEEDMLYAFDATSLENFPNVMAPHDSPYFDEERMYSAPYMWGTTGIGYRTDVVDEELEHSWAEIFDPRDEFKGEIGMLNEVSDAVNAAKFYLGLEPCSEDPEDWQQVQDLMLEQRQHVKTYNATGTDESLVSGEILIHQMWNGAAHRAWRDDKNISYLYPEEGTVFWSDNMVIPKGANNKENAKKFINFMMSQEAAAMTSNFTGYASAIRDTEPYLDDELAESPAVNVPEEFADRLVSIASCSERSDELRDRVWTRILQ